ncbi:MAG: hypothetical protein M5U34_14745 [Chloroflexi bacterium]|nr:hypothetical protein [Chloroflexota bacterium]
MKKRVVQLFFILVMSLMFVVGQYGRWLLGETAVSQAAIAIPFPINCNP